MIIIDGERNFFARKLIEIYTKIGIENCFTRVRWDYSITGEPSFQKRIKDQANSEWYVYDSELHPARAGLQCLFEDCLCDGSDNVGCTYCRMPEPDYEYY